MQVLAILTDGTVTVISQEMGMKIEDVTPDQLGHSKRGRITKNNTIVLDGASDKGMINKQCELIRSIIETTKSDSSVRSYWNVWQDCRGRCRNQGGWCK